jgi:hypothetical protein
MLFWQDRMMVTFRALVDGFLRSDVDPMEIAAAERLSCFLRR